MKRVLIALIALSCFTARAGDLPPASPAAPLTGPNAPASAASIEEFLALTDAQKMVKNIMAQMDRYFAAVMPKSINGHPITPEQKAEMIRITTKITGIFQEELTWEKLEPMYVEIYQRSFTQQELDGAIAFYKTPSGQAIVRKLPVVVQNTMVAMQSRVGPLMEKVNKMMADKTRELQKADSGKPTG